MNIAVKSTDDAVVRRYVLVIKDDQSWAHLSHDARFYCEGLGRTDNEARKIGFWSFVDGFIAPEALANSNLTECKFRRAGSFERVGRYLGSVMQRSDQDNGERDRVE